MIVIGFGAGFVAGCDNMAMPKPNACPSSLQGAPSPNASGIQWGGDVEKVSANIVSVLVECVPQHHTAVETNNTKRDAFTDYELAATATVTYKIIDKTFFESATDFRNMDASIIFEVLTGSGVVLGSAKTTFRIVGGGTSGNASAKISSLSDEEIRRVTLVRARWEYGH
jgi:hypothetical protein